MPDPETTQRLPDDNETLYTHLEQAFTSVPLVNHNPRVFRTLAKAIRQDPQGHVDALVAAGVLSAQNWEGHRDGKIDRYVRYTVIQPHVHEWRVVSLYNPCDISCECGATGLVPNRLPIEVPNA